MSKTLIGQDWYITVHNLCKNLSKTYNVPFESVVGILVSLSAQKSWKWNIRQTIEFLKGKKLNGMVSQVQLRSCKRILFGGENPPDVWNKRSFKYRNFYACILNPNDPDPVCVDTHMINWYVSKYPNTRIEPHKVFTNERYYTVIQKAIRKEAQTYNIIPSQYQAILWVRQRNGVSF